MRANVIFGSASDKHVYEPLCEKLLSINGLQVHFDVCSAHREPERLRKIIQEIPCDLFIAGAGIAAHLPGVIASQTLTPTIGVPIGGVLKGFDALMSIMQMPKGIPVLTAGIECVDNIITFVKWYEAMRQQPPALRVVASPGCEEFVRKIETPLKNIGWTFIGDSDSAASPDKSLPIWVIDLANAKEHPAIVQGNTKDGANRSKQQAAIAVPFVAQNQFNGNWEIFSEVTSAGGVWVGVNNFTNVVLSLLELWPVGPKERALLEELKGGGKKGAIA